jgi:hypothetical protein
MEPLTMQEDVYRKQSHQLNIKGNGEIMDSKTNSDYGNYHDVVDKDNFIKYCDKRNQWEEWLEGNNRFSVRNNLLGLIYFHCIWSTINEFRKLADEKPNSEIGFNRKFLNFLDSCFVRDQALGIRKLTEGNPKEPERAIISLQRVLSEMEENKKLITREFYLASRNLPYNGSTSESSHKRFDELSNKSSKHRSRSVRLVKKFLKI